jgi:hypothetical protein
MGGPDSKDKRTLSRCGNSTGMGFLAICLAQAHRLVRMAVAHLGIRARTARSGRPYERNHVHEAWGGIPFPLAAIP